MQHQVIPKILVATIQRRMEHQHDPVILDCVSRDISMPGFQALVSTGGEAESSDVVEGGLFCVADPEADVVE